MAIDRRALMQAAWAIARRFAWTKETWAQRLSRALKTVWWDAKEKARQVAELARNAAAVAADLARQSVDALRYELLTLENSDARLGWVSTLRRELAQRAA